MPLVPIDDLDDPRLDVYRDLPQSNLTRPSGLFIAEGWLLVQRLLPSRYPLASVLLDERFVESLAPQLPAEPPIYVVPSAWISKIVGFRFHRGVLACGRRLPSPELASILGPASGPRTVVVAVDVNDPENMGCILRNSAAFGVDAVVASRRCADPFSRRVLRTSMGTVFQLPIVVPNDLPVAMQQLRNEWQFDVAATVLDTSAEPLAQAARGDRLAIVFGNEGHGLSADIIGHCSRRVTIPMRRGTDSLNVGVASGVFLYHFCR